MVASNVCKKSETSSAKLEPKPDLPKIIVNKHVTDLLLQLIKFRL